MSKPISKIAAAGKEARVRELAGQGLSSSEIAAALQADGLDVSSRTVRRFLTSDADDRREVARHVYAEQARENAPLIIETLQELIVDGRAKAKGTASARDYARLTQAITGACRALHAVTMGDEKNATAFDVQRLREAIRRHRERADGTSSRAVH